MYKSKVENSKFIIKILIMILISIIFSLSIEIVMFKNNFFTEIKNTDENIEFSYKIDEFINQGYDKIGDMYVTTNNDPWFLKSDIEKYIDNIELSFDEALKSDINISIYYSVNGSGFNEKQVISTIFDTKTKEKIIKIGKKVDSIRIDIGNNSNQSFKLSEVKFNVQHNMIECYLIRIFLMTVLLISFFIFVTLNKNKFKICNMFLVFGSILGLLFILIMPINQIPDEHAHFETVYRYSNKMLFIKETEDNNTIYMRQCDTFFNALGSNSNKDLYDLEYNTLINKYDTDLVESGCRNVNNFPLLYIPAAIGVSIARIFNFNPIILYMMGRLINLSIFIGLGFISLKKIPIGKSALAVVFMFPMVIHQASSYSADSILNSVAFAFIAYCMNILYSNKINKIDLVVGIILASVLSPSKVTYFPMLFMIFLIVIKKYKNRKEHNIILLIFIAAIATTFLIQNWSIITGGVINNSQKINGMTLLYDGTYGYSTNFIFNNPISFIKILLNTFKELGHFYILSMIGKSLGWLNISINIIIIYSYILLFILACFNNKDSENEEVCLNIYQKGLVSILIVSVIILIEIALFSTWTHYGSSVIEGVQGRYFIPILPLIILLIRNNHLRLKFDCTKFILYSSLLLQFCTIVNLYTNIISS